MKATILPFDCPDNDIVRVNDRFYMLSTSMHFFPGCEILESENLLNWKHCTYVFDTLDGTKAQRLEEGNIYGAGMWAASFRYYKNRFYICFVANDTHKTYLYTTDNIKGPWIKNTIDGFYHDCSLLFDEEKVYIAYGNRQIYITELKKDLTGPKEGGLHRLAVKDRDDSLLGFEGTHFYKINGKYYLFFIHSGPDKWFRTQWCFVSDTIEGEFSGREIFADDNGYRNSGIAQGAIIDTCDGKWYSILFQDRGGSGRIPYLIPMSFEKGWPVIGDNGKLPDDMPSYDYSKQTSVLSSDDFKIIYKDNSSFGFKNVWQFNHEPSLSLIERNTEKGTVTIYTDKLSANVTEAKNSLTQRMAEPYSEAAITVDGNGLKQGDYAGISAFQFLYGFVGIRAEENGYSIVYVSKEKSESRDEVTVLRSVADPVVRFKICAEFSADKEEACFYYNIGEGYVKTPFVRKMPFMLEHFSGYRYALSVYSTSCIGGFATFSDFEVYLHSNYFFKNRYFSNNESDDI